MSSGGTREAAGPILVTGACGFVGRNLVRSLLGDCEELWLVDNLSTGTHPDTWLPEMLPGAEGSGERPRVYTAGPQTVRFFEADVISLFGPSVGIGAAGPGGEVEWPSFAQAFHLASIVGGRKKIEEEPLTVGLDLAIDSIFFMWASQSGAISRLLYASSSAAYPIDLQEEEGSVPLRESYIDIPNAKIGMPDMTYGWSKLTGEFLTYLLAQHHGVPACCVRPFSGYGEEQDTTYPVPAIAARAAAREDPLVVWGSGQQSRDFVHIDDCIVAMRRAIEMIEDGSGVNIGSGKATTFLEVAGTYARLAGYEPEVKGTGEGPVGVHARYADVETARARLGGWEPTISLDEGLGRVLARQESRLRATAQST
jgi:nucleoside-diphosphate-sugar epimerase